MELDKSDGGATLFGGVDWQQYYQRHGGGSGVDVVFADTNAGERIGGLVLTTLMASGPDDVPPYAYIRVLLPRGANAADGETWLAAACGRAMPHPITEDEWTVIRKRVTWVAAGDLSIATAVSAVNCAPVGTMTIIMDGHAYRTDGDVMLGSPLDDHFHVPERWWGGHVYRLVTECLARVEGTDSFVVVDVGERLLPNGQLWIALDALPDVGILVSGDPSVAHAMACINDALRLARSGDVDTAMARIADEPSLDMDQKLVMRAQVLSKVEHPDAARTIEAVLDANLSLDPASRVSVAHSARRAGRADLARRLLDGIPVEQLSRELLEVSWDITRELGMCGLARAVATVLQTTYAGDDGVHPNLLDLLKDTCRRDEVPTQEQLDCLPADLAGLGRWLGSHFPEAEDGILDVLDEGERAFPALERHLRLCLAFGSTERRWFNASLFLFEPCEWLGKAGRLVAWHVVDAIETYLIAPSSERAPTDLLSIAAGRVIGFLGRHPAEREMANAMARVLSPQSAGDLGIVVLAHNAVRLLRANAVFAPVAELPEPPAATQEEVVAFIRAATGALGPSGVPVVQWEIPAALIVPSADALLQGLINVIELHEADPHGPGEFTELVAGLACSLAKVSSTPTIDLRILRVYAGRLVRDGAGQNARDVAETIIALAGGSLVRQRLAWFGFGDIYLRVSNVVEGLLGIVCGMAVPVSIPVRDARDEIVALVRSLRDSGLASLVTKVLPAWAKASEQLGHSEKESSRMETARIAIAMRQMLEGDDGVERLDQLVTDATANLEKVLELADNALPAMLNLGQLVDAARDQGLDVADRSELLTKGRASLAPRGMSLFDMTSGKTNGGLLLDFLSGFQRPTYREDAGYDASIVTIAARRLLDVAATEGNVEEACFATELLTDFSIAVAGQEGGGGLTALWPTSLPEPAILATKLSRLGVDVVVLGMTRSERVSLVRFSAGQAKEVRLLEESEFSVPNFRVWAEKFPYDYGTDRATCDNVFFQTMERIGGGSYPTGSTVYVCDVRLQQLPPNILLRDEVFAGRVHAVASAPSLTWLGAVGRRIPESLEPPVAWVSAGGHAEDSATLAILAERIDGTCEDHGIPMDRSVVPPDALARSELAIVGAHGSLGEENRYFRVVADDGNTRLTGRGLSIALRGARIVILFVCSGGRLEDHPLSPGAVGLPRMLINAGCEVVIASPWPLNVLVPGHWLPAFLDAWGTGQTAMDAVFAANARVDERMGIDEAMGLAMSLYGNPIAQRWT